MQLAPIRPPSHEAIRRAALELLARNPGSSLAEVAARAGVGRATLHRHFASRDDLLRALALEALDATDAATADVADQPDALVALRLVFERLVPLAAHYHFLIRCPVHDPEVERRYAAQVAGLRTLVARLREQGHLDPAVPDAWAVALFDTLIWTIWSVVADGSVPARDTAALAVRTFLAGLASEGSR